jgi:endonuclease-3
MKKFFSVLAAAVMLVGCCGEKCEEGCLKLMKAEDFQTTVDGKKVDLYTLTNGTITMQVTNFGGRVVSLWTPDREGKMADIVLGYENIDRYVNNTGERFLGANVGRVANRIGLTNNSKTPLETEKELVKNIPEEYISIAHHWLILHGRYTCTARKPKCEICGLKPWCNYFFNPKKD